MNLHENYSREGDLLSGHNFLFVWNHLGAKIVNYCFSIEDDFKIKNMISSRKIKWETLKL